MSPWKLPLLSLSLAFAVSAMAAHGEPTPAPAPATEVMRVDLAKPFATRSPWRFVVTQGPAAEDYGGNPAPGELRLCLQKGPQGPCVSEPVSAARKVSADEPIDWAPHYISLAAPVYPRGKAAPPLLEIVTHSMHAGDGGQVAVTQLLKYDRAGDRFERIYFHDTGTNNNEEARYIEAGPLKGDVISAEPTGNAPFGYWIVVNRLTAARTYRQVLRYRSATHYGDGNPLAVIDSEMPNIEKRLGLWKPGSPLPLPAHCAKPRLTHMELWCS